MDPEPMAEWGRRSLQLATENVDNIAGLCREWQCKITLVVYPWPDNVAEGDRNSIQATHWRAWAAAHGARFIDGFAPFSGNHPTRWCASTTSGATRTSTQPDIACSSTK